MGLEPRAREGDPQVPPADPVATTFLALGAGLVCTIRFPNSLLEWIDFPLCRLAIRSIIHE